MCGITAAISTRGYTFDLTKIKLLACGNDHRGGDGVGIWFNNYEGLKKTMIQGNFTKFFKHNNILGRFTTAKTCILHTRKASKGIKNEDNLHPYQLSKDFIFCHNGTIFNTDELLISYPLDADIVNKTDSYILGNIIMRYGYEVLSKYDGAATLVWTDNGGKTLKVFKGASLNRQNLLEEERPLYLLQTQEAIYFNSLEEDLEIIRSSMDPKVEDISHNRIYEFKGRHLKEVKIINRGDRFNYEKTVPYTGWHRTWPSNSVNLNTSTKKNTDYEYFDKILHLKVKNGRFYNKKGKLLHGVYKIELNRCYRFMQHNNMPLSHIKKDNNFYMFYQGVLVNVDLMLLKEFNPKTINEVKVQDILNKKINDTVFDGFSEIPIIYNANFWYEGKVLQLPESRRFFIPCFNVYLYIGRNQDAFVAGDTGLTTSNIPTLEELLNDTSNLDDEDWSFLDYTPQNTEEYYHWIISSTGKLMDIPEETVKLLLELPYASKIKQLDLLPFFSFDITHQSLISLDSEVFDLLNAVDDNYFKFEDADKIFESDFRSYIALVEQTQKDLSAYLINQLEIYILKQVEAYESRKKNKVIALGPNTDTNPPPAKKENNKIDLFNNEVDDALENYVENTFNPISSFEITQDDFPNYSF